MSSYKADKGTPPTCSQKTLNQEKIRQGYFLACQCLPDQDMHVSTATRNKTSAIITRKTTLSPTVIALDIAPKHPISHHPGQTITLWASDQLVSSCYLASVETLDKTLTVHIERKANDPFSQWAHDCTQVNQKISISDVRGLNLCQNLSSSVALVAQDGCFAPILALLRKLCTEPCRPKTELFMQVDQQQNLYAMGTVEQLAGLHSGFSYQVTSGVNSTDNLCNRLSGLSATTRLIVSGRPSFIEQVARHTTLDILPLPYS